MYVKHKISCNFNQERLVNEVMMMITTACYALPPSVFSAPLISFQSSADQRNEGLVALFFFVALFASLVHGGFL